MRRITAGGGVLHWYKILFFDEKYMTLSNNVFSIEDHIPKTWATARNANKKGCSHRNEMAANNDDIEIIVLMLICTYRGKTKLGNSEREVISSVGVGIVEINCSIEHKPRA